MNRFPILSNDTGLKLRFSPFKNCFWREEWKKNSEKNLRPSSNSDLPIELVHIAIGALTVCEIAFFVTFPRA